MTEPSYEDRYCAFVDILGFRDLIKSLDKGDLTFQRLRHLLQQVHDPFQGPEIPFGDSGLRAQSISDAVALSVNPTPYGLQHLFFVLSELSLGLLFEGYLIRGAIVRGPLYHDDKMVFGRALVDAYLLENNVVRFPRIMVTRQVYLDATQGSLAKILTPYLRQDADGPYFLHVLRQMEVDINRELQTNPDVDPAENEQLAYYTIAGGRLKSSLSASVDDPRIFEKLQWFARYWNSMLPRNNPNFPPIRGPGLDSVGKLFL
jgi:hypothetical protein